jgi:hypothetical protein
MSPMDRMDEKRKNTHYWRIERASSAEKIKKNVIRR